MRRRGLLVGALAIPVYLAVDYYGGPGRALAAMMAFGMLVGAIWAFWRLRREAWFWLAIAALVVAHVVLVVVINWPDRSFPAPELWPVAIADFAVICGFIKLVEKAMGKRNGNNPPA